MSIGHYFSIDIQTEKEFAGASARMVRMRNAPMKTRRLTPGACMIYSANSQLPISRDLFMAHDWIEKQVIPQLRHIFTIDDVFFNGQMGSVTVHATNQYAFCSFPGIRNHPENTFFFIHCYVCNWSEPPKTDVSICVAPICRKSVPLVRRMWIVTGDCWTTVVAATFVFVCWACVEKCIYQLASNVAFTCSLSRFRCSKRSNFHPPDAPRNAGTN